MAVAERDILAVGEEIHHVGMPQHRRPQHLEEAIGRAVGGHPAHEAHRPAAGLIVGEERPASRRAEDVQLVVVENNLELIRLCRGSSGR